MTSPSVADAATSQPLSVIVEYPCSNCPSAQRRTFPSIRGHNTRCHPDSPPLVIRNFVGTALNDEPITEDDLVAAFSLKSKVGVLRRIPKGARAQAARIYVQLIRNCITLNDLPSWHSLFTFSFKAFHIPKQDKKDRTKSLVA